MEANTYSLYNTSTTGPSKANREELADFISVIEPEVTPVTSAISKGSTKSVFTEWLCDSLSPAKVNSTPEGHDSTTWFNKAEDRARLGNYINISKREFGVSDVQQMVDQAGLDSEIDSAKSKSVRELKRDIEGVVCGGQDRGATTGSYASRGLFNWIDSAGPSDVPANYRPPAASIATGASGTADMTEGALNAVLQSMFTVSGEKKSYMGVMSPIVIDIIDNFTRVETTSTSRYKVNEASGSKTINLEVKTFNSSFGIINMIPSVFLGGSNSGVELGTAGTDDTLAFTYDDDAGLILDTDALELKFLDSMHTETFEDRGGGPRGHAKAVYTLVVKNPKAHGKILKADEYA
jgi:hypothetical protein